MGFSPTVFEMVRGPNGGKALLQSPDTRRVYVDRFAKLVLFLCAVTATALAQYVGLLEDVQISDHVSQVDVTDKGLARLDRNLGRTGVIR